MNILGILECVTANTTMKAAASKTGCHLPKQLQRALAGAITFVFFLLYLSTTGSFESSKEFTYEPTIKEGEFPRKIWQTWKVDPLDFEQKDLTKARSWVAKNPGHRYEVLTDQNDIYYVETHYGPDGLNRPDIVQMYRSITAKIVKADLLRYLVMYAEGGVYTDIDVEALKPVDRFIPDHYSEKDVDMVIGVEVDEPEFINHPILGPKSRSFCQWTFMCKPRLPVMLRLIENIMKWLDGVAQKQKKPISDIELDFDEVISGTGPSAFTGAILEEMSAKCGRPVNWDPFHNMAESTLIGGVLVLTVEAFAAGQGHSDSGNHNARTALVKHHYHASGWPTKHRRFSHPRYGEVEQCNWNADCVKQWDDNTAAFDALSPEEQTKELAIQQGIKEERERELEKEFMKVKEAKKAQEAQQFFAAQPPQGPIAQPQPFPQAAAPQAPLQQGADQQPPAT